MQELHPEDDLASVLTRLAYCTAVLLYSTRECTTIKYIRLHILKASRFMVEDEIFAQLVK